LDVGLRKRTELIHRTGREDTPWHTEVHHSSPEIRAENHYLLVLRGHSNSMTGGDTSHQRTGRWTPEEVTLTDFLVQMFDDGRLPMEQGMKLSDFLADILLCKSSRLTKKMKNSQLGTRSYSFRQPIVSVDGSTLSNLLDRFIRSIPSEPTRYELQFNISKFWRARLSNLALEMHQPTIIDVSRWVAGLECIEQKAIAAQERIRVARRRRLGIPGSQKPQEAKGYAVESLLPQPIFPVGFDCTAKSKRRKMETHTPSLSGTAEEDNVIFLRMGFDIEAVIDFDRIR